MRPPECDICGKQIDYQDSYHDYLVRFSDYKELPPDMVGHPDGLLWICDEHREMANELSHLSSLRALQIIREKLGI